MNNISILVAEDDTNIRNGLVDTLESEGYKVTPASEGEQALKLFAKQKFDLILLDIMMPGKSGYDVCRAIRESNKAVPIIMLTAKSEEVDKVVGLQLGADDYVTKPFGVHELLARIAAALRRTRQSVTEQKKKDTPVMPDIFKFGKAEIDAREYRARVGTKTFDLSDREVKLLDFFRRNPGKVLTRDELLNAVWGIDYFGTTRTLDQHIAQLRKKVETKPDKPGVITTIHGVGYRYDS
ncbi:MAG: response regulator transcription factor [bacterium]